MKICLVCSHGGHLLEILQLVDAFEGHEVFFVTYRSERTKEFAKTTRAYLLENIGKSPLRLLMSLPQALRIVLRERPRLIVSTGSEVAIPFFYLAKLLRIKTVFIESVCRVRSPSATGKLVYPAADLFLVQWEQLLDAYGPKARFEGGIL